MTVLTPYAAAKIANARFAEVGMPTVPPQMLYNYTTARLNKGKAPFIAYTPEEGVDRDDLQRWIEARVRKAGKQVADPDQLAFDMAEAN